MPIQIVHVFAGYVYSYLSHINGKIENQIITLVSFCSLFSLPLTILCIRLFKPSFIPYPCPNKKAENMTLINIAPGRDQKQLLLFYMKRNTSSPRYCNPILRQYKNTYLRSITVSCWSIVQYFRS